MKALWIVIVLSFSEKPLTLFNFVQFETEAQCRAEAEHGFSQLTFTDSGVQDGQVLHKDVGFVCSTQLGLVCDTPSACKQTKSPSGLTAMTGTRMSKSGRLLLVALFKRNGEAELIAKKFPTEEACWSAAKAEESRLSYYDPNSYPTQVVRRPYRDFIASCTDQLDIVCDKPECRSTFVGR